MNSSSRSQLTKKARSVLWDLRILVVDDEEFSRTLMQDNLTRLCEHVDAAGNGEQAYELYQQHYYDLIITDLEMPVKNGFWLIEKIRQDCFFKPILVITAFSDDKHSRQCLDLGVTGFIPKPVDLSLLYINLYRFGSGLHEKKVMFQYQQELERYTKTCHVRMEQLKILQSGLEGVLTPEIKKPSWSVSTMRMSSLCISYLKKPKKSLKKSSKKLSKNHSLFAILLPTTSSKPKTCKNFTKPKRIFGISSLKCSSTPKWLMRSFTTLPHRFSLSVKAWQSTHTTRLSPTN